MSSAVTSSSAVFSHVLNTFRLSCRKCRGKTQFFLSGLLLLLKCSAADSQKPQDDYCLSKDPLPFSSFGTWTAYEAAEVNLDTSPVQVPGCRAVHLWLLDRHGTRQGEQFKILSILRLPELQDRIRENIALKRPPQLCAEDLSRVLQWSPNNLSTHDAFQLTERGRTDMKNLGQRLRSRFPTIFQNGENATFQFWYDMTPRSIESSDYLRRGVLGSPSPPFQTGWDSFPYFFGRCPPFQKNYISETANGSYLTFQKSKAYTEMTGRVSSRLGFTGMLNLSEMTSIIDACSEGQAQRWGSGESSPWCAVFRDEDFQVLEYYDDIRDYYNSGYGHEETARFGCAVLGKMARALQSRVTSGTGAPPAATSYASHDLPIKMAITYLGLYRDDEMLRPDNFNSFAMKNRKWRTSKFSPFAANLGATVFECKSGEKHRVQLFLNENPLVVEGCEKETRTCTWTQFANIFRRAMEQCDETSVCQEQQAQ